MWDSLDMNGRTTYTVLAFLWMADPCGRGGQNHVAHGASLNHCASYGRPQQVKEAPDRLEHTTPNSEDGALGVRRDEWMNLEIPC
eukprot:458497-Amphidinium_carterae.2